MSPYLTADFAAIEVRCIAKALGHVFQSPDKWVRQCAKSVRAEHQCSKADAKDTAQSRVQEWWDESLQAIEAGATPPQWWVNAVSGHGRYTRWESFLKHRPNVFDRLAATGLSLYMPKAMLAAKSALKGPQ